MRMEGIQKSTGDSTLQLFTVKLALTLWWKLLSVPSAGSTPWPCYSHFCLHCKCHIPLCSGITKHAKTLQFFLKINVFILLERQKKTCFHLLINSANACNSRESTGINQELRVQSVFSMCEAGIQLLESITADPQGCIGRKWDWAKWGSNPYTLIYETGIPSCMYTATPNACPVLHVKLYSSTNFYISHPIWI